jgi:hypothetical protein
MCTGCKHLKGYKCEGGEVYAHNKADCDKFDAKPVEFKKFTDEEQTNCFYWADLSK